MERCQAQLPGTCGVVAAAVPEATAAAMEVVEGWLEWPGLEVEALRTWYHNHNLITQLACGPWPRAR